MGPAELAKLRSRPLPRSFFERHTLDVAADLLGKILIVDTPAGTVAGRIVETEAYRGDDPASHSSKGETPRASIMFGPPGVAYVYFIYGMYEMLNFVTEPKGDAGAVLIRALEPVAGEELMRRRRGRPLKPSELASGPGKLCRALGIEMAHNGERLDGPAIRVTQDPDAPARLRILASPRVGISAATGKYWRFYVEGSPCVSRAPQNSEARPWRRRSGGKSERPAGRSS